MGGAYAIAHGSPAQQQHQQPQYPQQQQQAQQHTLALTPARNVTRALDFPRYCSRAAPPLPTIHSFPSLEGMPWPLSPNAQAPFCLWHLSVSIACIQSYLESP